METIKLFHTFGFKPSEEKIHRNNFLPATLHCLTNIKFLTEFISNENNCVNKLLNSYKNLLQTISKTNEQEKRYISIEDFEKALFEIDDYQNDKEKCNPKFLFDNIINNFHNFYSQNKKTTISDNISVEFQTTFSCQECSEKIEEKEGTRFLIYNICKEYNNEDGNKDYNIHDCIRSYLNIEKIIIKKCEKCKKETKQDVKKIYKTLPKVLIIQVDYGNDKNYKLEKKIIFNEELDFSKISNIEVEEKYKDKKYYLSSLICVREIMVKKKEYFYTFCRKNDSSKYYCYNEEMVHEVIDIKKKLEKNKINLDDKKQRFPYILIYTSSE